ncbi:MAG: penicillin-binding protein [Firmicutes bacterium]|nr:penicillin-binding protein [Bacillota bacterium]
MKSKRLIRVLALSLVLFAITGLAFTFGAALILEPNVPIAGFEKLDTKRLVATPQPTLLDNDGNKLEHLGNRGVDYNNLPPYVINAFIAAEDKRFYNHKGVDYYRMAGAALNNLKSRSYSEGASTISQQLIKNTHLSGDKKITRKIQEIRIARKLERANTKEEILEMYFNILYFGGNIYGLEAAARYYFGVSATELDLGQSAMLAGVINNPSRYSPIHNFENATKRRNLVLGRMKEYGLIANEAYEGAVGNDTVVSVTIPTSRTYITNTLREAEGLLKKCLSGYTITTYYDSTASKTIENALNDQPLTQTYRFAGRGVVICNRTHGIIADTGHNIGNRPPASVIKPIICYAPALERRLIAPLTPILDAPINYNGYTPKNNRGGHRGWITIEESMMESDNIPAVKLLDMTGIDYCKSVAKNMGINFTSQDKGYALALGGMSEGVTLTELCGAYSTFANGGMYSRPRYIKEIADANGRIVYSHKPYNARVIGDDTAYLITSMLRKTAKHGTAKRLKDLPFQVAAKTGTHGTEDGNTDAYAMAYTSKHTIGIWHGSLSSPHKNLLGGGISTNTMRDFLGDFYKNTPPPAFVTPDSVDTYMIDGKELYKNYRIVKATDSTKTKKEGLFSKRNPPRKFYSLKFYC